MRTLGFVRPPAILFAVLAATVIVYLGAVQVVKVWFYRRVEDGVSAIGAQGLHRPRPAMQVLPEDRSGR